MTGPGFEPGGFRRRRMTRAQRESLPIQIAVVCTGVVIGLLPLTAPLPAMSRGTAAIVIVGGLVLTACVAALGLMVLVPSLARTRTTARVLIAASVGTVAAAVAFGWTSGLISRPLLLVAGVALLLVVGDTAGHARRR